MKETTYWPKQKDKIDLTFVIFYSLISISFLAPFIGMLIFIPQNEVKSYTSTLTVIEKYEKEDIETDLVFNPATEMSQVKSNSIKRYIIVVNYANAEEGKSEIKIDKDSYNKINIGDKVNVKISESYPSNETNFESEKMLYYKISYIK
ncbi:MAG: hypothetical protein HFJ41_01470 [Clostridia bacterium]|nr:hypothetical protein [Clostridia bacterium]